jgi:hypothetical protein
LFSLRTASKWLARWRAEGELGLLDRSSAPVVVANRTDEPTIATIAVLRRLRFTGPEISETLGMPLSTVSGILTRIGMGRLGRLGLQPAERYEAAHRDREEQRRARERRLGAPGDEQAAADERDAGARPAPDGLRGRR